MFARVASLDGFSLKFVDRKDELQADFFPANDTETIQANERLVSSRHLSPEAVPLVLCDPSMNEL